MIIRKAMPYGFVLTLLFSQFVGAETPERIRFNKAVSLYQEGLSSCLQAHKLRASDLNKAKKAYKTYEAAKNKAIDLAPQILTTTEFNIDRNIKLCEQAKADILRSEAIPVIETAIDLCKRSKSSLLKSKVEQSRSLYNQYLSQKQQAFELATDVIKVQSIRINVSRCDKFENKLNKSEIAFASLNQKISVENSKVWTSYQLCSKGSQSSASARNETSGTTKAKQLLAQAQIQLASVGISSLSSIKLFSDSTLGKKLLKEMAQSKQCQTDLAKSIQDKDLLLADAAEKQRATQLAQQAKAEKSQQQKALYQKLLVQKTQQQKLVQAEIAKNAPKQPDANSASKNSMNKTSMNKTSMNKASMNKGKDTQKEVRFTSKPMPTEVAKKKSTIQRDWTNLVANAQPHKNKSLNSDQSEDDQDYDEDDEDDEEPTSAHRKPGLIKDWTQLIR